MLTVAYNSTHIVEIQQNLMQRKSYKVKINPSFVLFQFISHFSKESEFFSESIFPGLGTIEKLFAKKEARAQTPQKICTKLVV